MNKDKNIPYILLPFNFVRIPDDKTLLTNMVGEYIELSDNDFDSLINYRLDIKTDLYANLDAKHFLTRSISTPAIELLAIKYRTKKSFLYEFTSLHMFVITQRCNQSCSYCQVSSRSEDQRSYDMTIDTAKNAVDTALSSPAPVIKIEFQGGEPLLNFKTLKFITEYASRESVKKDKRLEFVVCTNLTMVNEKMLKFFSDKKIFISTSLDGPKHIHDNDRRYKNNKGSYEDFISSLEKSRKYLGHDNISALMTTTKYSLRYAKEIVDAYVEHGFNALFVRLINPFGYANEKLNELGYSTLDFITFYKDIFEEIIKINLNGYFLEETFATILLRRILTPFASGFVDLQFPAGTGIMGVIYGYDGNVYISDEARMLGQVGDHYFCIGNVNHDTYTNIFYSNKLREIIENSCAELLPECSDCAFQIYCGIDPVRNYATQKDIMGHRPTNECCIIHKEIFKFLFSFILSDNRDILDIFWSWITHRNLSNIDENIC